MKKILMSVLFLLPVCAVYAANGMSGYAELGGVMQTKSTHVALPEKKCVVTTCPDNLTEIGEGQRFIYANSGGGGQCYSCNSSKYNNSDEECELDAIVGQKNPVGRYVSLYRCTQKNIRKGKWYNFNPKFLCDNSPVNRETSNTETYYLTEGSNKSEPVALGDHTMVKAGNSACVYYVCKGDLVPNADKSDCIVDTRESVCVNSGGTYAGGVCSCNAGKKLKQNADKTACECVSADYEYKPASKKCEETEASKQRKRKEQQKSSQQKCVASGGVWHGDNGGCECKVEKYLVVKGLVCECKNGFERDNVTNECKITDLTERKNKCDAASASGAYWDNGECRCRDIRKDFVGGECTEKADIQKCNKIKGAEWSDSLGCVCEDSENMEFNKNMTECVEKAELREKRDAAALIARVKETHQKLQKRQAGMKVSVWKDAEGNFNTARLVSDSVAGVVLGTAGGLITSSVVKKNQVENGFEDLKCTVGGQIVADWGDQFRVGIQ